MWTKQSRLTALVLGLLSTISVTFSQTIILNKAGDTLTCLSQPQVKFLLKEHYAKVMYKSLDSICEVQRALGDSIIASKEKSIEKQYTIMKNQKEIISLKDHEIASLKLMVAKEQRQVRIQKALKWIYGGVGGGLSLFLGYKYVTKK